MKKLLSIAILISILAPAASAITVEEITTPKPPAARLGTGHTPEKAFKITESTKKKEIKTKDANYKSGTESAAGDLTYADLSLKKIAKEVADDAELDSGNTVNDIKLLWIGAAQHSETVKFIIYKLSNPDEDKPDQSIVKKIIKPLATAGSLAGIGMGNPVAAIGALMGSSVLGNFSTTDKDLNYRFTKVNDADMIVLIRKIEELQRKICNYYFDYMAARGALQKTDEMVLKRQKQFNNISEYGTREQILLADAYYRAALQTQNTAKSEFLSKRAALEQTVGMDTMAEFEEILTKRGE